MEIGVQRHDLLIGAFCPVLIHLLVVYESAPYNNTAKGFEGFGEHVGAIGMASTVILWARHAFGIGLDQESAKIRDVLIDFLDLFFPPFSHLRDKRIRRIEIANTTSPAV